MASHDDHPQIVYRAPHHGMPWLDRSCYAHPRADPLPNAKKSPIFRFSSDSLFKNLELPIYSFTSQASSAANIICQGLFLPSSVNDLRGAYHSSLRIFPGLRREASTDQDKRPAPRSYLRMRRLKRRQPDPLNLGLRCQTLPSKRSRKLNQHRLPG